MRIVGWTKRDEGTTQCRARECKAAAPGDIAGAKLQRAAALSRYARAQPYGRLFHSWTSPGSIRTCHSRSCLPKNARSPIDMPPPRCCRSCSRLATIALQSHPCAAICHCGLHPSYHRASLSVEAPGESLGYVARCRSKRGDAGEAADWDVRRDAERQRNGLRSRACHDAWP